MSNERSAVPAAFIEWATKEQFSVNDLQRAWEQGVRQARVALCADLAAAIEALPDGFDMGPDLIGCPGRIERVAVLALLAATRDKA